MNNNLSIEDLSIGFSAKGMMDYRETVRLEMFENTIKVIDDNFAAVVEAINGAWQGVSRDRFVKQIEDQIGKIKTDLIAEYNDLDRRFQELEANYYKEDEGLIKE